MPPKQRFGSDQERPPPASGEQTAECSQDRSIGGPVPHAGVELALETPDLVPEHHDLDVPVRLGSTTRDDEAKESAHSEVEEGEHHGG